MSKAPRVTVPLYYDFASTLCYVAHRVLQRMEGELAELALELVWTPVDLVRLTGWPRDAEIRFAVRSSLEAKAMRTWQLSRMALFSP